MIYLLGNNISEFSLNETMTVSNYEGIIEDLSDFIVKFTESWSSEKLTQFLKRLYEHYGESQYLFFKIMIHYFTFIFKKKYKNNFLQSEIKEFLRQWDLDHAMDSFITST